MCREVLVSEGLHIIIALALRLLHVLVGIVLSHLLLVILSHLAVDGSLRLLLEVAAAEHVVDDVRAHLTHEVHVPIALVLDHLAEVALLLRYQGALPAELVWLVQH